MNKELKTGDRLNNGAIVILSWKAWNANEYVVLAQYRHELVTWKCWYDSKHQGGSWLAESGSYYSPSELPLAVLGWISRLYGLGELRLKMKQKLERLVEEMD